MSIINSVGRTPLSEEEKDGLLIPSVTTQEELNRLERNAILEARIKIYSSRRFRKNLLTLEDLCLLHAEMFRPVWSWAGSFRKTEKNIGVDPWQISTQLFQLCKNTQYQIEHNSYNWPKLAADFHHKLVQIHPFSNGNGRHARFTTDLLARNLKKQAPSWGNDDLNINSLSRDLYIEALKAADDRRDSDLLIKFMFC